MKKKVMIDLKEKEKIVFGGECVDVRCPTM